MSFGDIKINPCPHCKSENKLEALYCEMCAKLIADNPKYERLTVKELKNEEVKLRRQGFISAMVIIQLIFTLFSLMVLFSKMEFLAMLLGWSVVIALCPSIFILGKNTQSLKEVEIYLRVKDENINKRKQVWDQIWYRIAFKKFNAGEFKKNKNKIHELKQRFTPFDIIIEPLINKSKKYIKYLKVHYFLFVIIFSLSIPLSLMFKHIEFEVEPIFPWTIAVVLPFSFIALYPIGGIMANIEQLQEEISEIGKNFNEKDYEDFIYSIEAKGFKLMNNALWSVVLCLLSLIVIYFYTTALLYNW